MADILEMLNGKRIKNINVIHTRNIFPIISLFLDGKGIKHDSDDCVPP